MKKAQQGFTLLEAMIVIAILAVLTAFAMPYYGKMLMHNAMRDLSNRWISDYYLAQTESTRLQKRVIICASGDGENCNGTFEKGWIVGYCQDGNFKVLQDSPPLEHKKIAIDFKGAKNGVSDCGKKNNPNANNIEGLQFLTTGRLPLSFRGGSLTLRDESDKMKDKLIINISATGRINTELTKK